MSNALHSEHKTLCLQGMQACVDLSDKQITHAPVSLGTILLSCGTGTNGGPPRK